MGDLTGGLVAKTLSSHCRGPGFDPWSATKILHASEQLGPQSTRQQKILCATTKTRCSQINT